MIKYILGDFMNEIQKQLFSMQDLEYRTFHSKLMPTVDPEKIIGIRTPVLRKFANEFAKTGEAEKFLADLPHIYYEENNLHAFVLEKVKDFDRAIKLMEEFMPYMDNWATCDMCSPKVFKKNKSEILPYAKKWMKSAHTYTVRYGIGILMNLFLDEDFDEEYLNLVASVKSEEYYINMMIAWYFATALAKQYNSAVKYIEHKKLDTWVHNKTIQKAVESYRVPKGTKEYLKTLKIK